MPFCWHPNFVPWGLSAPARGYIHVLNHKTNCIKSDFEGIILKLASNEWNDKTFLLTLKLCPLGAVCPCPGAIYMYKIKEIFFKTCNKWPKCQDVPFDIKISSLGVVSPCPGATCIKSWKKLYKIRLQRDFFEICSKWLKWQEVSVDIKILSPGVVCPWPAAIYIYLIMKRCV